MPTEEIPQILAEKVNAMGDATAATSESARAQAGALPTRTDTSLSAQLAALRGRQEVAEVVLLMLVAHSYSGQLDKFVDGMGSLRKEIEASSDPVHKHAVKTIDWYIEAIGGVRNARRPS